MFPAACEEERLMKLDYVQRAKENCTSTHIQQELSALDEQFRKSSGSDIRLAAPQVWTDTGNSLNCLDPHLMDPYNSRGVSVISDRY